MRPRIFNYIIILICLIMAGCAVKSFNQKSYQILKSSQSAYDLATDSIIELNKRGLISEKDYKKIEATADDYAEAHNVAVDAIKAYNMGILTAEQTGSKITAVSAALTELLRVAQPYILKLDKEK